MSPKAPDRAPVYPCHPIKGILSSRQPGMALLKYLLVLVIVILGLTTLQLSLTSLLRPLVFRKDFIQEYLLARAVLNGVDPYLPLPELASRFLGPLPNSVLQHPTPHPPAVALISLPLGVLSYEQAAAAWLLFEIICNVAAIYLLLLWFDRRPGLVLTSFVALAALGWNPFFEELITGQLMTLLLLLLTGAWLALRAEHTIRGGMLLGLTIALKLIAWPIILFLVIRKSWRAVITAGVTTAAANVAAALLMGFDNMLYYYQEVGGTVASLYKAYEHNFSLWTVGWRVFEGTGSPVVLGFNAPPLVVAPALARLVSFAIPLVLLGVGLVLAVRVYSFDASFSILVCVSILVSPIAWRHYLVLALIPLVVVGRRLVTLDWPKKETNIVLALGLLFFISRAQLGKIILTLADQESAMGASAEVPFAVGLLSFVPTVVVLGLTWFLWHLERAYPAGAIETRPSRRGWR